MNNNNAILMIVSMMVSLTVSCVKVSFEPLVNDNMAAVTSAFDWGAVENHPDTMTIISARTEREIHYAFGYSYNSDTETGKADTVSFVRGEYYSIAFGFAPDAYILPDLTTFLADRSFSIRDIVAKPRRVGDDSMGEKALQDLVWDRLGFSEELKLQVKQNASIWNDITPRTKIYEADYALYSAGNKSYANPSDTLTILFEPKELTVSLDIRVPVLVASEDIEILGAFASLTGIPSYVSLMTGELVREDLGRVFLPLNPDKDGVYEGKVKTLGLFSPDSQSFIGGPGILYVYFITRIVEDDETVVRVSQPATKNLWSVIASSSSTMTNAVIGRDEYNEGYVLKTDMYTLNVPAVTLSKKGDGDVQFKWLDGGEMDGDDWYDGVWDVQ